MLKEISKIHSYHFLKIKKLLPTTLFYKEATIRTFFTINLS